MSADSELARVLIVEDEPEEAQSLRERLQALGVSVDIASDPKMATEYLQKLEYPVVITDVAFDGHQTGEEFLVGNDDLLGDAEKVIITGMGLDQIEGASELDRRGVTILQKGSPELLDRLQSIISKKLNKQQKRPATDSVAAEGLSDREEESTDWFDQATIDRFSDGMWRILEQADAIRSSQSRPAISTLHLTMAFAEQPGSQLLELLNENQVDLPSIARGSPPNGSRGSDDSVTSIGRKFPRITHDVRMALVNAREKADEYLSATIEDTHLLFGLLSLTGTDNLLIYGLNARGVTADKIRISIESQAGPSTHVARDRWTVQDALGYFPYAYAIYRFLTDKNTAPPLAISIQAPWGGGKTSMMRMIQAQLDPEAGNQERITTPAEKAATVRDVTEQLDKLSAASDRRSAAKPSGTTTGEEQPKFRVRRIPGEGERRVTIWFNAWKYESTSQVWAGLADSILRQVADRLEPAERELFWLRLQLRRIDSGKVRRKIHEQVLTRFLERLPHVLWAYVAVPLLSGLVAIIGKISQHTVLESWGWAGTLVTSMAVLAAASKQWTNAKSEVEDGSARVNLGELVEAPDYRASVGFVHQVASDLHQVFSLIPNKHRPMVVFIDDLDRCSPNKVSDVIEAINLFLAGEFPDCMFVLGIDDEMVAAALDKAHSDVIAKLPSYAKSASIGWRFMDKFVQLPFIVPPPTRSDLNKYAESLLSEDSAEEASADIQMRDAVVQAVETSDRVRAPHQIVEQVAKKKKLTAKQRKSLEEDAGVIQRMDRNIRAFSDEEKRLRALLAKSAAEFSINPRDIKRFVNVFRFYYFLRSAREARRDPVPSLNQLSRWILFSLKWPEAVRYLWRAQMPEGTARHPKLEILEKAATECQDQDDWRKRAGEALGIKPDEKAWFWSQEIMQFFASEAKLPDQEKLSASYGKGLW